MEKLLFLDIDGVLNRDSTKEKSAYMNFCGLDKYLVEKFLHWYRQQNNLKIILSSSWRDTPIMIQEIEASGIPLSGLTTTDNPYNSRYARGWEVEKYLKDFKHQGKYAILDDCNEFYPHQLPYFVRTSHVHGLRDKDIIKLNSIYKI